MSVRNVKVEPHRVVPSYLAGMYDEIKRLDLNIQLKKSNGLDVSRVRRERDNIQADIDAFLKGE